MRIKLVVLAFLVVLLASAGLNAAFCSQDDQVQRLLVEISEEAIRAQGQARITGGVPSGPHSDSYREFLLAKADSNSAEADNAYSGYDASFVVKGVRLTKGGAIVALLEHGILTYANPADDPGIPAAEEYVQEHEVGLRRENDGWKLVKDKVLSFPRLAAPVPSLQGVPLPPSSSPLFSSGLDPKIETKSFTLSRTAAANYALKYWQNPNPNYRNWLPGNDCTNFVSQAMRAGGWTDVLGWYNSTSSWWYTSVKQTLTWINAHAWGVFTYNRPRALMARYVSYLRVGDVLQANWDGNATIDHTMIVTSKSDGEIFLTYHSGEKGPVKNKRFFGDLLVHNPKALWYGYQLSPNGN